MENLNGLVLQFIAFSSLIMYILLCLIFYFRMNNPKYEDYTGIVLLFFTFLSGFLGAFRMINTGINVLGVASILLIIWSFMEILLDYVYKYEFRTPPKPLILVPYLIFLIFPLSIYWTVSWSISPILWGITAFFLAVMSYLIIKAAKKGLG